MLLITTTPASLQFFPKLFRLPTFFLKHSASHHTYGYRLCSVGVLPQVFFLHRRLAALCFLQADASPHFIRPSMALGFSLSATDFSVNIYTYSSFPTTWLNTSMEATLSSPPMPSFVIWSGAYICNAAHRIYWKLYLLLFSIVIMSYLYFMSSGWRKTAHRWCKCGTFLQGGKLEASIWVHNMHRTPSGTTINFTNVLVAFPAATV